MSYTPTQWATGDTITAQKLNKLEQGVASAGGGGVTVIWFNENGTLDITAGELINAALAGPVSAVYQDESSAEVYYLSAAVLGGGQYTFDFGNSLGIFYASSADDYPSMESSGGGGN